MSPQQLIHDNICFSEILEVTGVPCSGKTTYINKVYPNEEVLLGGVPIEYNSAKRVFYSVFLIFYSLINGSLKLTQTWWLIVKAFEYNETLFAKMNALRNCMIKFGYMFFKKKNNPKLIDEGISHIPFILGLEGKDIDAFITLFRQHLKKIKILFIQTPTGKTLEDRIISRGHKRLRSAKDAQSFNDQNIRIAVYYEKALISSGFHVSVIEAQSC